MESEKQNEFENWNILKQDVETRTDIPYFNEREVWFCHLGRNIGFEQNGKGSEFIRPVLVIKKCNKHLFVAVPLTSQIKSLGFYFPVGRVEHREAMAILVQMRPLSSKRLINKIATVSEPLFLETKSALKDFFFES